MRFAGPLHDRNVLADALPERSPDRISGGLGAGGQCAICGARVEATELEFQLEFAGEQPDCYTVHLACYSAWKSGRQELEASRATVTKTELSGAAGDTTFAVDERQPPRDQEEA